MNKPDWGNAPDWARWTAMDSDGTWYWYDRKPTLNGIGWTSKKGEMIRASGVKGYGSTLEENPDELQ